MMELKLIKEKVQDESTYRLYEIGDYKVNETIYKGLKPLYGAEVKDYQKAKENYQPAIYFEHGIFNEGKRQFVIQTTSYGSMDVEEIEKIVAGYREAVEVAKVLNEYIANNETGEGQDLWH